MTTQLINPHDCFFIQSRAEVNFAVVDEYAAAMATDMTFDPVQGILDPDGHIYIWDGYHRGEAAKKSGVFLDAALQPGTKADAEWRALSANIKHGLRRTPKDLERVVKAALTLKPETADRELGRHCGVDHKTVARYRKELNVSGEIPQIASRTVERNGTAYQMQTARQVEMPMPATGMVSDVIDCDDGDDAQQAEWVNAEAEQRYHERLRRCQAVVGRCFNTRDGIVKVLDVNTVLARIRTLRYGKDGKFYSLTENREVAELLHEVGQDDFQATMPAPKPAPNDEPPYCSEHRTHWTCTACQKRILSGWGRFYPDGRMICAMCMDAPQPTEAEEPAPQQEANPPVMKPECYPQKAQQVEISTASVAEEMEAERQATPKIGICTALCDFCLTAKESKYLYHVYNDERRTTAKICGQCADKAANALGDKSNWRMDTTSPFNFYYRDRIKIIRSGVRLFRVEEHTLSLKEFTWAKSTSAEGIDPSELGSWQKVAQYASKAALKRQIDELDQDEHIIFENRF